MVDVELSEVEKALKTGCALEKRQLGDFYALSNATALALPIAWKLLPLKSKNLAHPEAPATQVLDADELEVLRHIARKPLSDAPSVHEVVCAISALGGHLKHNGAPGGKRSRMATSDCTPYSKAICFCCRSKSQASGGGQVTDLESVLGPGPQKPSPVPGPDPTAPSKQTELPPLLRDQ